VSAPANATPAQLTGPPVAAPAISAVPPAVPKGIFERARMDRSLARAIPTAIYRLQQLGPIGLVGLAAILTATAVAMTALVPLQHATADLRAKLAAPHHPTRATVRPEDELGNLLTALPGRNGMPAVLGEIAHQATLAGVTLTAGHYSYSPPKSGAVGRYELEFPVRADYPGVRDFINRTLTAVPAAALDKLHIERKSIGDSVVSADVRFVVFVKSGLRE
jgi:hypothetical protein